VERLISKDNDMTKIWRLHYKSYVEL